MGKEDIGYGDFGQSLDGGGEEASEYVLRDPLAVPAAVGDISDTGEHETWGHDERGRNGKDGPRPAALEDGRNEADSEREPEHARNRIDERSSLDRFWAGLAVSCSFSGWMAEGDIV